MLFKIIITLILETKIFHLYIITIVMENILSIVALVPDIDGDFDTTINQKLLIN